MSSELGSSPSKVTKYKRKLQKWKPHYSSNPFLCFRYFQGFDWIGLCRGTLQAPILPKVSCYQRFGHMNNLNTLSPLLFVSFPILLYQHKYLDSSVFNRRNGIINGYIMQIMQPIST